MDEIWKPADFTVGGIFKKKRLSKRRRERTSVDDLKVGFGPPKVSTWVADDFKVGIVEDKEFDKIRNPESEYHELASERIFKADDFGVNIDSPISPIREKRSVKDFLDSYMGKEEIFKEKLRVQNKEQMFHLKSAQAASQGGDNMFSKYHEMMIQRQISQQKTEVPRTALGAIDINVIFIRHWLEEKGTSLFGNKFALFFILFTIAIVGGIMTMIMSGVVGDLLQAFKYSGE